MGERVISVKMPASLVRELKKLTAEQHYIDLSEQVRSVVRQKCLKYTTPYQDIDKLRVDMEKQIKGANTQRKEQLLQELVRLLKEDGQ